MCPIDRELVCCYLINFKSSVGDGILNLRQKRGWLSLFKENCWVNCRLYKDNIVMNLSFSVALEILSFFFFLLCLVVYSFL